MQAPASILQVWRLFQGIPMETFTKGWWSRECGGSPRQRTVAEMTEHRQLHGTGGNCFDLAVWLRHALHEAGIQARITGHDLGTGDAHAAVVATDPSGQEFLCDLGDLWLQPILISHTSELWHAGFFPGREIQVHRDGDHLRVYYRRGNGKVSHQAFGLAPVPEEVFQQACHHSQNLLRRPFCEALLPHPETGRISHWEYDRGRSFWNLDSGPVFEEPCVDDAGWIARICQRTGISAEIVTGAFDAYGVKPGQAS